MIEWVETFIGRAAALRYGKTQRAVAAAASPVKHHGRARSRMSHTNPTLPSKLFKGQYPGEHKLVTCPSKLQHRCVLCSYTKMKAKIDGDKVIPQAARTQRICAFCDVNLCTGCFTEYHQHN